MNGEDTMSDFGLAVWAHGIGNFGATPDEMRRHLDRLAGSDFDTLIPCVKNMPGTVDFRSRHADTTDTYPDWDPLRLLIDEAGARGMGVHAWLINFAEQAESRFRRACPTATSTIDDPHGHQWMCACRQEVQDHVFALYSELASEYGPVGLHLDYIRTGGWCTCDACRSDMSALGVDIANVSPDDAEAVVWARWKSDRVASFVARMHEMASAAGIALSAAVIGDYPHYMNEQGQDWERWVSEGTIDMVFPMNYNNSTRIVGLNATAHVAHADGRVPVWEGLCKAAGKTQLTPEQLAEQVASCCERGAAGVSVFHYPALTNDDMAMLRREKAG